MARPDDLKSEVFESVARRGHEGSRRASPREDVVGPAREEAPCKTAGRTAPQKAKLVDPLQYTEMSIQAEDLAGYVPAFGWEAGPPTEQQVARAGKLGILPDAWGGESAEARLSLLLDRLAQAAGTKGLHHPKSRSASAEKYGFQHAGRWSFEQAEHMIDRIAAKRLARWYAHGRYRSSSYTPPAEPAFPDSIFGW